MSSFRSWRSAVAALLLAAGTGCRPAGERALIEGDKLLAANRPAEAIPLLERAVETLPQNAVALNRLGLAYQYAGRFDDARKQYLRALKADQNLFEAQHNLGILYFQTENWTEAERCFRIWLGRHPEDIDSWNRLGLAQFRDGASLEAAEQSLATVARANRNDPDVWNTLGLISIKRHKYKEAQQRFSYGLKLDGANAPLHLNLAVLLHQYLNDRHDAVIHYKAFLDLSPNAPEAPSVRAALLLLDPPPTPSPRADVITNHLAHPLAAPAGPTNTPAPTTIRPPPAAIPSAEASPAKTVATTDRRGPTNTPPVVVKVSPPSAPPAQPSTTSLTPPTKSPVVSEVHTNMAANSPSKPVLAPGAVAPREIVKVEDELKLKPAVDSGSAIPTNPPSFVQPSAPATPAMGNLVVTNGSLTASAQIVRRGDVADPAPASQGKPKSFWKRVNPVSWFKSEAPREVIQPKPTPLEYREVAVSNAIPETRVQAIAKPVAQTIAPLPVPAPVQAPPPKPVIPRYRRQSADRLVPGDRRAAEPEFNKGSEAQRQKNYTDAIAAYREAIDFDRSYFEAHYNLSLAALDSGDASQAVLSADDALLLQPSNDDARLNFAIALQRAGFPADAAEEYEKLSAKRPNDAALHLALASLYAREMFDAAKARPHYERVIAINPQHPKADAIRAWLAGNPR